MIISKEELPEGAVFKGFQSFKIQDLKIETKVIELKRARYQLPDGKYIIAPMPDEFGDGHFGRELIQYILYQYHSNNVPQNKILDDILDKGIQISEGQLNNILINYADNFKQEYEEIRSAGIKSKQLYTDDTSSRHQGKNGYCFVIQNEFFAYFKSGDSKSRIAFLTAMLGEKKEYIINEHAIDYLKSYDIKSSTISILESHLHKSFVSMNEIECFLKKILPPANHGKNTIKIIIEAALFGELIKQGVNPNLILLSDGAFQYVLFLHALCWIHMARPLKKFIAITPKDEEECNKIKDLLWTFYDELKEYKKSPNQDIKQLLSNKFDEVFNQTIENQELSIILSNFRKHKDELLRVLDHPDIELHNNSSESDIRTYVIKRKIHGSTRSDKGKESRDIFASLRKTCRKNNISFWSYLDDRLNRRAKIKYLPDIIKERIRPTGQQENQLSTFH